MSSFASYLAGRMQATSTSRQQLAQALTYRTDYGPVHPDAESIRKWLGGQRPRSELVIGVARFFGDDPNKVLAMLGRPPMAEPVVPATMLDERAAEYRQILASIPNHMQAMVHRQALAVLNAANQPPYQTTA